MPLSSLIQLEVASLAATSLTLSWNIVAGQRYRVQYQSEPTEPSWTVLAGDIPAGATMAIQADGRVNGVWQQY